MATAGLQRGLAARLGAMGGGLSAKSYVQDGLIHLWDGIENDGYGVHNDNLTIWKDLVGSVNITLSSAVAVEEKCLFFSTAAVGTIGADCSGYGTIEDVIKKSEVANQGSGYNTIISIGAIYSGYGISANAKVLESTKDYTNDYCVLFSANELLSVTFLKNGTINSASYKNGSLVNLYVNNAGYGNSRFNIGSNTINSPGSGRNSNVRHYCIRLYNRNLTAPEIAANYAIDKARFGLT